MANTARSNLDRIFSTFIRMRDRGQCYTCPRKGDIRDMECGHFVDRKDLATRFDEVNCNTQCNKCNNFRDKKEMLEVYARRLDRDYGPGTAEGLKVKSRKITKNFDYPYWNTVYKEKVKDMSQVQLA